MWRRALGVLGAFATLVLVVEVVLWGLPRAWLPAGFGLLDHVYTARSGWSRMIVGDPYLGYTLKPDLDMLFPSEGRSIHSYSQHGLDLVFRLDGWWLQLIEHPDQAPAWKLMQGARREVRNTAREMNAQPVVVLFSMKEKI